MKTHRHKLLRQPNPLFPYINNESIIFDTLTNAQNSQHHIEFPKKVDLTGLNNPFNLIGLSQMQTEYFSSPSPSLENSRFGKETFDIPE